MLKLNRNSLDWALAHALTYGDTDTFPTPFEYQAIDYDSTNVISLLANEDVLAWDTRPHLILMSPKARYGFRLVSQLDPLDFLLFAAAVYEIGRDLESARIPATDNLVFSHRFDPASTGIMFNFEIGYQAFNQECRRILAEEGYSHVCTADVADFYPRIYHHRLENELNACTTRSNHVKGIMRLLWGWNNSESYGIPVGSAPARLLAEIVMNVADQALLAQGIRFIRYNDDYRLFARSHTEGYRSLVYLAEILYRSQGLTLQEQKTRVVSSDSYIRQSNPAVVRPELQEAQQKYRSLLDQLNLPDSYQELDYNDLDPEQKRILDSLNLAEMFRVEITAAPEPDWHIVRFVLRCMGQFADDSLIDEIFTNVEILFPILPDIIRYFKNLRKLDDKQRREIGSRLIGLLNGSIVAELVFHRMWIMEIFASSSDWDNEAQFQRILAEATDHSTRRQAILSIGRASQRGWIQSRWRNPFDEAPWTRRALLAAASCMPADARRHFYRSIESRLDPLELAVTRWALAHPIGRT